MKNSNRIGPAGKEEIIFLPDQVDHVKKGKSSPAPSFLSLRFASRVCGLGRLLGFGASETIYSNGYRENKTLPTP